MNCPYCQRQINAPTGFQEAWKFKRHLHKCRKNPNNMVLSDGEKTIIAHKQPTEDLLAALELRAASGQ